MNVSIHALICLLACVRACVREGGWVRCVDGCVGVWAADTPSRGVSGRADTNRQAKAMMTSSTAVVKDMSSSSSCRPTDKIPPKASASWSAIWFLAQAHLTRSPSGQPPPPLCIVCSFAFLAFVIPSAMPAIVRPARLRYSPPGAFRQCRRAIRREEMSHCTESGREAEALHRLDIVLTALIDIVLTALEVQPGLRRAPCGPCLRGQLRDQRLPALCGVGAASRRY